MAKFSEIFLIWRKARGSRRKIVAVLRRTATNGITFEYKEEGVNEAKADGFKEYPGFPVIFNKKYEETNLDIFSLRLVSFERTDNDKLLEFWEAKGIDDKFDLLAKTQGLLPTDNFEFLGNFNPSKDFKFVTDLAGLSHLKLQRGTVSVGDHLSYSFEKNEKAPFGKAVKVWKGRNHVGYIKIVHENIFHKTKGNKLGLVVKEIEQNGIIKNIFVLVNSRFK